MSLRWTSRHAIVVNGGGSGAGQVRSSPHSPVPRRSVRATADGPAARHRFPPVLLVCHRPGGNRRPVAAVDLGPGYPVEEPQAGPVVLRKQRLKPRRSIHGVIVPRAGGSGKLFRLAGQEEGLRLPLGEVTVVIGLAQQPGAHYQPGLVQPLRHPLRPPPPEVEGKRVTQRF
jgi:hypothetical protein